MHRATDTNLLSPPRSKTPSRDYSGSGRTRLPASRAGPFDAAGLASALDSLARTPRSASPQRKRPALTGDRFIPVRSATRLDTFSILDDPDASPSHGRNFPEAKSQQRERANHTYAELLRAEMFDDPGHFRPSSVSGSRTSTPSKQTSTLPVTRTPGSTSRNLFSFLSESGSRPSPRQSALQDSELYSSSPLKPISRRILSSPPKPAREIPKIPFKVLDAPELADDFYLNLVDWGKLDILAVGLRSMVYLWNSATEQVTKLCELPDDDVVTSVSWSEEGTHLAVGTGNGDVLIYDAVTTARVRKYADHDNRVGSLAWNSYVMTSGGRDRAIFHRDVRQPGGPFLRLTGHRQEVCGLKWNTADNQLASGGNDNKLLVWDRLGSEPLYSFAEHKAAVKAIAWSPHRRGLLASGGGTADRTIKFWDTHVSSEHVSHAAALAAAASCASLAGASGLDIDFNSHNLAVGGLGAATASARILGTGPRAGHRRAASSASSLSSAPPGPTVPNLRGSYDTGSQVCNLAWSRTSNELVSTHGYSQNQILVWRYPSMQQIASLTGHTYRVLYLALAPDNSRIVTGAGGDGDETLRFWNVFPKQRPGGDDLGPDISVPPDGGPDGSGPGAKPANPFYDSGVVEQWGTIR